jgi:hypothetical protein
MLAAVAAGSLVIASILGTSVSIGTNGAKTVAQPSYLAVEVASVPKDEAVQN